MGLSSQKWVYQDFSVVGIGRRPRRGEKAREEGGTVEAQILLFSPSSPLLRPPLFLPAPALSPLPHTATGLKQSSALRIPAQASREVSMPSSQTRRPSLVFTLSRSQADLTERNLHRLGCGSSTQLVLLWGPFHCPLTGCCGIQKLG